MDLREVLGISCRLGGQFGEQTQISEDLGKKKCGAWIMSPYLQMRYFSL